MGPVTTSPGADPRIELLYVEDCPNQEALLPHLRELLPRHGVSAAVRLVRIEGPADAARQRFLGSPTLRVDGVNVDPTAAARTDYGLGCRLYPGPDGGAPTDDQITRAVRGNRS